MKGSRITKNPQKTTRYFGMMSILILVMNTVMSQPVNKEIDDYAPPAPNAAAMQKFFNIPVNPYNGTAGITVPITTINEGPIQVPIQVSYNTSGIKAGELASWVGLGWYMSAGGSVTRTIVGLQDDKINGYMTNACENYYEDGNYDQLVSNVDCEADIFHIAMPGKSYKMLWAAHLDADGGWYTYPRSDLKIKEHKTGNTIIAFEIRDTDGTIYIFGHDYVEYSQHSDNPQYGTGSSNYISSWFLKEIKSSDLKHSVHFAYELEMLRYPTLGSNYEYSFDFYNASGSSSCTSSISNATQVEPLYSWVESWRLSEITQSSGDKTVQFLEETAIRQDLMTHNYTNKPHALDYILIQQGGLCHKYDFSYQYSQSAGGTSDYYKRLVLHQIQEVSCDEAISIPPYIFEYTNLNTLPHRLTKQIDHWGYYNGKTQNDAYNTSIPANAYIEYNGEKHYYGDISGSNVMREADSLYSIKGSIQKVTYPTGGYTEYTMAPNTEYGIRRSRIPENIVENRYSNCNTNPNANYIGPCVAMSALEIVESEYQIYLDLSGIGNGCPSNPGRINVKITALPDIPNHASCYLTLQLNQPPTYYDSGWLDVQGAFTPALEADVPYYYQIEIEPGPFYGEGDVYFKIRTLPEENNVVGGLRVFETKSYTQSATNPIKHTYQYNDAEGKSHGLVLIEPRYGTSYQTAINGDVVIIRKFTSFPLVSTTDISGDQVGYTDVSVLRDGAGRTVKRFEATKQISTGYPIMPLLPVFDNGAMVSERQIHANETLLALDTIDIQVSPPIGVFGPSNQYYVNKFECFFDPYPQALILHSQSSLGVPAYARPESKESIKDGVSTITTYDYDSTQIPPTEETTTNSNGDVVQKTYKYAFEYPAATLRDSLLAKNMLLPAWETTVSVNGTTVDGNKTEYGYYNSSGQFTTSAQPRLYPYKTYRYTFTWDGSENPQGGTWLLKSTIPLYDMAWFKPKTIQKTTLALPIALFYNTNGQVSFLNYGNFTKSYQYLNASSLVNTYTMADGQLVSYGYDALKRLTTSTQRNGNITESKVYQYQQPTAHQSWIEQMTQYSVTPGSQVQTIGTRQYYDGLGREDVLLQRAGSPTQMDVAAKTMYDIHSRPTQNTELVEFTTGDGSYQAIPSGTLQSTITYEESPLDRLATQTPPAWYATTNTYHTNTTTLTDPEGTTYPAQSLMVNTVTDPDNKITETYTDKVGRVVLTVRKKGSDQSNTWTVYDDKNRPVRVYPPGTATSSPNLIYVYRYDGDDNLIYRKVPDAAAELFRYSPRNLMTASQNAVLASQGKWLVTHYDDYGRPSKRGYHNGSDPGSIEMPTIHTLLEEYFYDGYNGSTTNTAPIYKGKLKKSRIKVLEDAGADPHWVETEYSYDSYGRVSTESVTNHLGNPETITYTYDMADNVLTETRSIGGANGVPYIGSAVIEINY